MMGPTGRRAVRVSLLLSLDGSAAQWNRSAHRSVLSDGGGPASIILIDGDETVLLTAGHGPQPNDPSTPAAGSMGRVLDWEPHAAFTGRQVGSSSLLRTPPGLKTTDSSAQPGTKRGLVGGFCNHSKLFEPHARNWQYDYTPSLTMRDASWAQDPACREIAAEKTFEFVPMVASLNQLPGASSKLELVNSRHLLGMNEPSDGKNESAALAASRWKEYEALAATASPPLLLGTPAPGGLNLARGQRWLHDFFGNCTGCRVDIVAVHWYECDGSTDATAEKSAEGMMRFLAEVWAAFSKPIWLTEFNCGDGDPADNPYANQSAGNHLRFMKAALPKLEAAEHVARYSWFQAWQRNTPTHPGHNPGCSLTTTDGSALSELGEYYNSFQLKNDETAESVGLARAPPGGKCPVPVGNPAVHKGSTFSHPVAELNTFTNTTSYAECCARCGAAPKCYALTWVGNDSSTHPNTCWLRAQVGPFLAHPHPVSYSAIYPGRKPCAPPACTFPPPPPLPKPPPPPPPKPGGCVHLHGVCSRTVHCCAGLKCNGSGGQFRCRNK